MLTESRFLFRIDMARENDAFFELWRDHYECEVYSGIALRIGQGWMPDMVDLSIDTSSTCLLTLIELEATAISARASCRKYLPEDSTQIVKTFLGYLDTVIVQCRTTSDPRLSIFENLRSAILENSRVAVHTAGALRVSADLIEDLPLIDQPVEARLPVNNPETDQPRFVCAGHRKLTRSESEGLNRAVKILHSVVVGLDNTATSFKSWRNWRTKPLKRHVEKNPDSYPQLYQLIFSKMTHGLHLDCDVLANELSTLWSSLGHQSITSKRAAAIIDRYVPIALAIREHESMSKIFDDARAVLQERIQ